MYYPISCSCKRCALPNSQLMMMFDHNVICLCLISHPLYLKPTNAEEVNLTPIRYTRKCLATQRVSLHFVALYLHSGTHLQYHVMCLKRIVYLTFQHLFYQNNIGKVVYLPTKKLTLIFRYIFSV
jgi:hypothetical protein